MQKSGEALRLVSFVVFANCDVGTCIGLLIQSPDEREPRMANSFTTAANPEVCEFAVVVEQSVKSNDSFRNRVMK